MANKRKIINDPVYGFITLGSSFIYDIIQHPFFQRLRRIRQLGLAELVYPAAVHSRFQHAMGAMFLMEKALETLQSKGVMIMEVEKESALAAILLHDLGHGPFSHVMEFRIFHEVHHEYITLELMKVMNKDFHGKLDLAIKMFEGSYHRKFFHQLISGQLDVDRLDYIKRDSFFTGVSEGTIGVDRIIHMLNVADDNLILEEKGLLSIENFLNARRLMYWQVYLHKTSICGEVMLGSIFARVRDLLKDNQNVPLNARLSCFLTQKVDKEVLKIQPDYLVRFTDLDDTDIWSALKDWSKSEDQVLRTLTLNLLNRRLFKLKFNPTEHEKEAIKKQFYERGLKIAHIPYFMNEGTVSNAGYVPENSSIKIQFRNGELKDFTEVSDLPNVKALSTVVKKSYISWDHTLYLQPE